MHRVFRQLLKEYPNGTGTAQANYWIGGPLSKLNITRTRSLRSC